MPALRHSHKGTRKPTSGSRATVVGIPKPSFRRRDNERRRMSFCFQRKRSGSAEKKPGHPRRVWSIAKLPSARATSLASQSDRAAERHLKASNSRYRECTYGRRVPVRMSITTTLPPGILDGKPPFRRRLSCCTKSKSRPSCKSLQNQEIRG